MSNVAVVLDLLPAVKKLRALEDELRKLMDTLLKFKDAKPVKALKGKWGISGGSVSVLVDTSPSFREGRYQVEV